MSLTNLFLQGNSGHICKMTYFSDSFSNHRSCFLILVRIILRIFGDQEYNHVGPKLLCIHQKIFIHIPDCFRLTGAIVQPIPARSFNFAYEIHAPPAYSLCSSVFVLNRKCSIRAKFVCRVLI